MTGSTQGHYSAVTVPLTDPLTALLNATVAPLSGQNTRNRVNSDVIRPTFSSPEEFEERGEGG